MPPELILGGAAPLVGVVVILCMARIRQMPFKSVLDSALTLIIYTVTTTIALALAFQVM